MWHQPSSRMLPAIVGSALLWSQPVAAVEAGVVTAIAQAKQEACHGACCTALPGEDILGAGLRAMNYFKVTGNDAAENFAISLAASADGETVAIGAPDESGGAIGVGGNQAPSLGAAGSGAVYILVCHGRAWSQQAYLKASNASAGDSFGISVSLSGDGNTLAVGAYLEDSPGTGINGNQGSIADNSSNAGAVYVFTRVDGNWSQQAYVKASNTHANAYFGHAVSLDGAGNTLAVGAIGDNAGGLNAGAVYLFTRSAGLWSQQAYVKAAHIETNAYFGFSVALNGDGDTLAIGAHGKCGTSRVDSGAVYVFIRSTDVWSATGLCKSPQHRQ